MENKIRDKNMNTEEIVGLWKRNTEKRTGNMSGLGLTV